MPPDRPAPQPAPPARPRAELPPFLRAPFADSLLGNVIKQWILENWKALASIQRKAFEQDSHRAVIALFVAVGHLQVGWIDSARALLAVATQNGVPSLLAARILASGAHTSLANAHALAGDPDEAASHYHQSLEMRPCWSDPPGSPEFATPKRSARGKIEAIELLEHLIENDPENDAALTELAKLEQGWGRWLKAAEIYGRILKTQKLAIDAIVSQSQMLRHGDALDQAIKGLEHARSLGLGDHRITVNLAIAYRDVNRWEEAEKLVRTILSEEKDYSRTIFFGTFAADVLRKRGDLEEAYQVLRQAIETRGADAPEIPLKTRAIFNELQRELEGDRSGQVSEVSKEFYDEIYESSEKYKADPRASVYLPVWKKVVAILRQHNPRSIIDIGCGPGQCARYLLEECPGIFYHGYDYSATAIRAARETSPNGEFFEADVMGASELPAGDEKSVFLLLEVLEHIQEDLQLLGKIPPSRRVVFSVPNFDSFGHVRFFADDMDVHNRYAGLFESLSVVSTSLAERSRIFLATGVRASGNNIFENNKT